MHILYVDDEPSACDAFSETHRKNGAQVDTQTDALKVASILSGKKKKELPDIIVMDLYRPGETEDRDKIEEVNRKVAQYVRDIAQTRAKLQDYVNTHKVAVGIEALKDIKSRSELREIPVILTTREGLALVADDKLRESVNLGAEWMIKGRGGSFEWSMIDRAVHDRKETRRNRKQRIVDILSSMVFGCLLSLFCSFLYDGILELIR